MKMRILILKIIGVSILKKVIVFAMVLMLFATNYYLVNAESKEKEEVKPFAEDWYVTTEDIFWDIIFPTIDKRVIKEYGGNEYSGFGWGKQRIINIVYNNNHSYDLSIKIQVPDDNPLKYVEDLVKVRVSPSCESPKISCSHGFNVEVLEYEHLNQ